MAPTTIASLRGLGNPNPSPKPNPHPHQAPSPSPSPGALTILRRGTDKSRGLAAAAAAIGVEAQAFLALGDHANDLGMFAWAGQSLCPSNASERAKAAATLCSHLSNDGDFIVDALAQAGALY